MPPTSVSDWGPATDALTERGYAVLPGAMPELGWQRLRAEAEHLFRGRRLLRGGDRPP